MRKRIVQKLDAAYAAAMAKVTAQFPNDNEIATLYAEALMDFSARGITGKPVGRERTAADVPIVPTFERVLESDPDHAAAIHLYIHAVEASADPKRAEPYADRLASRPDAGHLVHMPSHIYFAVGAIKDSLQTIWRAVKVDETYLADTNAPPGVYKMGYYPHNVHFVMVSAQMAGDGKTVIAAAEKLGALIPDEAARVALVQPVKAAPYFAHAQFSSPEAILALPDPGDAVPYVKAIWLYARAWRWQRRATSRAQRRRPMRSRNWSASSTSSS